MDGACPLPFDVPFRVGPYCLTLRHDRAAEPDWEMYSGPAPGQLDRVARGLEARSFSRGTGYAAGAAAGRRPDPSPIGTPIEPEARPLTTAQGLGPNPEFARTASVRERWETRWRVAGAELKARSERSQGIPESTNIPTRRVSTRPAQGAASTACAAGRAATHRAGARGRFRRPGGLRPSRPGPAPRPSRRTEGFRIRREQTEADRTAAEALCDATSRGRRARRRRFPSRPSPSELPGSSRLRDRAAVGRATSLGRSLVHRTEIDGEPVDDQRASTTGRAPGRAAISRGIRSRQRLERERARSRLDAGAARSDVRDLADRRAGKASSETHPPRHSATGEPQPLELERRVDRGPCRQPRGMALGQGHPGNSSGNLATTGDGAGGTDDDGAAERIPSVADTGARARPLEHAGLAGRAAGGGTRAGGRIGRVRPVVVVGLRFLLRLDHDRPVDDDRPISPAQAASRIGCTAGRHVDALHCAAPRSLGDFSEPFRSGKRTIRRRDRRAPGTGASRFRRSIRRRGWPWRSSSRPRAARRSRFAAWD